MSNSKPLQRLKVPKALGDQPAIQVLRRLFRPRHPSFVEKILRQERILVDGRPVLRDELLSAGQELVLIARETSPASPQPNRRLPLDVRHEDASLAIIAKRSGVPMHPGAGHGTDTILNALVARYGEDALALGEDRGYGMVHRLDRETSGLFVVARSESAYAALREQFEARKVKKIYVALVHGSLRSDEGMLGRDVQDKPARTDFRVIERFDDATLLEASPVTGRMHQVRIHFAGIAHPVVGETRYDREVPVKSGPTSPRLFLHARDLSFTHPGSGELVKYHEPLPSDLSRMLRRLRRPKS